MRLLLSSICVLALLQLPLGCSRSLPEPSSNSPLSSASPSGKSPRVDVALTSDPPLPGESREGWEGLAADPSTAGGHSHHHHGPAAEQAKEVGHAH